MLQGVSVLPAHTHHPCYQTFFPYLYIFYHLLQPMFSKQAACEGPFLWCDPPLLPFLRLHCIWGQLCSSSAMLVLTLMKRGQYGTWLHTNRSGLSLAGSAPFMCLLCLLSVVTFWQLLGCCSAMSLLWWYCSWQATWQWGLVMELYSCRAVIHLCLLLC